MAEAESTALLRSALRINAFLGAGLIVITASLTAVTGLRLAFAVLATGLMVYIVLVALCTALEAGLRARRRLSAVVATNLAEKSILIAAIVSAMALQSGLAGVAIAYVVGGSLRFVLDYHLVLRRTRHHGVVKMLSLGTLLRAGAPFAVNSTAFTFVPRLDLPLVAVVSATAAGYFSLGYQIFTTLVLIPVIGGSTLYPFIARFKGKVPVQRVAVVFGLAGFATAAVGIALAPALIPAIFGAKYRSAVVVTQVILAGLPLVFYANGLLVAAYTRRRERELLRRTLPAAVIGSAAVVLGTVVWGATGAALGFGVRYVFFTAVLTVVARRDAPSRT